MKSLFFLDFLIVALSLGIGAARAAEPKAASKPQKLDGQTASTPDKAESDKTGVETSDEEKTDADNAELEPQPAKKGAGPTSMDITPLPGGEKTLTIHFRWSLFPKGSVEVRLVPGVKTKGVTASPMYVAEQLQGKVCLDLYDCLDHVSDGGRTHTFTKEKVVYTMIGRRNSLGNQGVYVKSHPEEGKPDEYPAIAYEQLDTWAVDKETLSLDLPRDEFARPGTLFVWFFRGDRIVWEEQIRWSGYK